MALLTRFAQQIVTAAVVRPAGPPPTMHVERFQPPRRTWPLGRATFQLTGSSNEQITLWDHPGG